MNIEQWLGEENKLGIDIWHRKYQYDNESFDEWLDRVSGGDEDVKRLIIEKKFLFAGRILSNRGVNKIDPNYKASLANCYVLDPPEDNIESIFDCAKKMARTYSYGGGVGVDISQLSPKGARVSNTAKYTTGAVSFMDLYSTVTGLIGQMNRRGALMLSISCEHPDFEEFIGIKTDLNRVTKANISVRITDEFMKAVKEDKEWTMTFIRDSTGEVITKTAPARLLFRKIAETNWDFAEPGMLFWDRIESYNLLNTNKEFTFVGTNPSLRKGTLVLTDSGVVPIESLEGKQFKVPNLYGNWSDASCFLSGHNKPLYRLELENGKEYYCTAEHKWAVRMADDSIAKIETTDLKKGYELPLSPITDLKYGNMGTYEDGLLIGFLYGDGSITELSDNTTQYGFTFGNEKIQDLMPFVVNKINDITGISHNPYKRNRGGNDWYEMSSCHNLLQTYMRNFGVHTKDKLPDKWYSELSEEFRKGFIDGLFSTDGCVCQNSDITLSNKSHDFIESIRDYLMWYGIRCSSYDRKTRLNGRLYDISVIRINRGAMKYFRNAFSLSNKGKQFALEQTEDLKTHQNLAQFVKVKSIELTDLHEDVWDITVFDTTHCFRLNGCITGNCGEEPLGKNQACCLGSLNLAEFVDENKRFNYHSFYEAVQIAFRGMNDVLMDGIPLHPLATQRYEVNRWRQIGLGVMGIADMLVKMELTYGSPEAVSVCNSIAASMAQYTLYASANIAKEQGVYPAFNKDELMNSSFYKAHQSPEIDEVVNQYGLAHSQLLTIAPTGSLSTMIGVSGGIEPIFANYYTRKTESLHGEDVYYKVYTPIVDKYMKEHGITDDKDLPEWFVTAGNIDYHNRIDMQAAWQKHIDASISSTVNLPHEATVEDVEYLYMYAWEKGLKGITVYRDGCKRSGILTTSNPKKQDKETEDTIHYDSIIPVSRKEIGVTTGNTYCKRCACGTLYITINHDKNGNIVETFINTSKGGVCQANTNAVSRMVSTNLRSGVKVSEIADQLKGIRCPACIQSMKDGKLDGISCADILAKTLLEFYKELNPNGEPKTQTKIVTKVPEKQIEPEMEEWDGEHCPKCGAKLMHRGGCVDCPECAWSKCS